MNRPGEAQPAHRARKRFGQNFLVDERIISQIIAAIDPRPGEIIVEIGPGRAALTGPLLESGPEIHALEIDRDLAAALRSGLGRHERLTVHQCDALQTDPGTITGDRAFRLVGNLPYNISTPLIFHVLEQERLPADMHFMLQSEVVQRIAAGPGSRDYGRLSVMCQNRCRVTPLFDIPPTSFEPRPKVQSTLVRMVPRDESVSGAHLEKSLDTVARAAFSMRRKTLRNSLRKVLSRAEIADAGIDAGLRAEQLSLEQFIALAGQIDDPGN
jgi:16S rRNA (adenine1518-N6/adenine1519-N6)-dimethyltransferase